MLYSPFEMIAVGFFTQTVKCAEWECCEVRRVLCLVKMYMKKVGQKVDFMFIWQCETWF